MSSTSTTKVPKEGWVLELSAAERDVEAMSTPTSAAQLRIATAAFRLRQWRKCKKAAALGLTLLEPEGGDCVKKLKKELKLYQTIATEEYENIAKEKKLEPELFKYTFDTVFKEGNSIDHLRIYHVTYGNLNLLQYAAVTGNLVLLEEAVALGAAIDYPVLDPCFEDKFPALPGTTALLLLCQALAMYGITGDAPGLMTPQLSEMLNRNEACAIALVQLGADCSNVLPKPSRLSSSSNPLDPTFMARKLQLGGKTARELAGIARKPKLISVMREFATEQDKIDKAHCRCGSRLPWLQCHAGEKVGRVPHYMIQEPHSKNNNKGGLAFRFSPLAKCACKHTQKTHWKCCWRDTARPAYQNDSTARLCGTEILHTGNNPYLKAVSKVMALMEEQGVDSEVIADFANQPLFQGNDKKSVCKMIRSAPSLAALFKECMHPNDTAVTWDTDVFAGCVERIDKWFLCK